MKEKIKKELSNLPYKIICKLFGHKFIKTSVEEVLKSENVRVRYKRGDKNVKLESRCQRCGKWIRTP